MQLPEKKQIDNVKPKDEFYIDYIISIHQIKLNVSTYGPITRNFGNRQPETPNSPVMKNFHRLERELNPRYLAIKKHLND